jgi:hypothetical protein
MSLYQYNSGLRKMTQNYYLEMIESSGHSGMTTAFNSEIAV